MHQISFLCPLWSRSSCLRITTISLLLLLLKLTHYLLFIHRILLQHQLLVVPRVLLWQLLLLVLVPTLRYHNSNVSSGCCVSLFLSLHNSSVVSRQRHQPSHPSLLSYHITVDGVVLLSASVSNENTMCHRLLMNWDIQFCVFSNLNSHDAKRTCCPPLRQQVALS
jgi:hypothetical protein